jgi:hypothetical protein
MTESTIMKIENMTSGNGNKVPNQFILYTPEATYFQSYNSVIVKTTFEDDKRIVILDSYYWNYSKTTSKYRNQFLGETTKETEKKIKDGIYRLEDLNA